MNPVRMYPAALSPASCASWVGAVDRALRQASQGLVAPGDYTATSSSLRLRAVPEADLPQLLGMLMRSEVGQDLQATLGSTLMCCASQCWVRRQFPFHCAPPDHHPHGWHQDGALGFDFLARTQDGPDSCEGLLEMQTCWIALTPCGSQAPGLEFVARPWAHLLTLPELQGQAWSRPDESAATISPVLKAGDALVFGGDAVHRTQLTEAMTQARTSIEFRFAPAHAARGRLHRETWLRIDDELQAQD